MTTLTVLVDPQSRKIYKLNKQRMRFDELREKILKSDGLGALQRTAIAASKSGLKKMTTKDIEREITTTRRGKNRS